MSAWVFGAALASGVWYFFILLVQAIGFTQLFQHYSSNPKPAVSPKLDIENVPHITILRPVKGLEPQLYECLASTFRQEYPAQKLTIYFCIASTDDPAYPVLQRLLLDFPQFDAKIFIEEQDPNLSGDGGETTNLGPNPKIRNMSRGYREAKGDIMWIIDCNVWVGRGVAGRMVDKLCGFKEDGKRCTPYKFVHQLPLVVDSVGASAGEATRGLVRPRKPQSDQVSSTSSSSYNISPILKNVSQLAGVLQTHGGRIEEMFMAGSHAKFYTAINTVAIAPCIVGKSNMFRRSHLDFLTSDSSPYSPGIDYFSENICEDHLIGDLLWRKKVPGETTGEKWNKHGLVFGDLAIQPMAEMSVHEYIARRVRWLRVRKWTVPLATFVEHGVEPLVCSAYGAFALTTLPWFSFIPQNWRSFGGIWLINVVVWMFVDSLVFAKLHSGSSVEVDIDTPSFALPLNGKPRRSLGKWILTWMGREFLTLPIWLWAWGGMTVMWRGKKFRVGLDMKVKEIQGQRRVSGYKAENGNAQKENRLYKDR
ncbi:glycosyltransferase family 21 protein [Oidiodendron maius Zn]|uniref:Ceramide glucosyltransferase n=1 Tax=Oidiodendron maius (strain Zn) TaxID=913774 RepID=A0A0C3DI07_OIDMZ|nr:glycosyltransferase family 21 protein [Oidiodendron maius Zn]